MSEVRGKKKCCRRPMGPPINFEQLPDWVPPAQAAQYLRSGVTTIYVLCQRGVLPCRRFGRLLRVSKEALRPEIAPHIPKSALAPRVEELAGV